MYRLIPSLAVGFAALISASASLAADLDGFRSGLPGEWDYAEEYDPLTFEAGLRYWYSRGSQTVDFAGESISANDTSHILESHFRIDDSSTSSFVKGQAGYAVQTSGTYNTALLTGQSQFQGGQIGYAGADFGWTPFGNDAFRFGGIVGYQFLRESPDRARLDVAHIDGLNIHALRLGFTANARFSDLFDINAELAAIPYAHISGATAETPLTPFDIEGVSVNRMVTELEGAGYGASGELMLGFHPTDNLTFRVGGRAWLLHGPTSSTTKWYETNNPDAYIYESTLLDGFSLVRYGALGEVTGRF